MIASRSTANETQSPYRILVAVAFDATDDAALHEAMDLVLKRPKAELHVVHAIPGSATSEHLSGVDPGTIAAASEKLLDCIDAACLQTGDVEVVAHVCIGDTARAMLSTAIDVNADVIVVGSHRRSVLQRLFGRSVGERVLRGAHCPVLIAVTKDYEDVAPHIDPPCDDCLHVRAQSANRRFWCERHGNPHLQPHVYIPRQDGRSTVLPTY